MCGLSQNLEIYMPILGYTLVRQDSNMINKRGHRRVEVDFWVSLGHVLAGLLTRIVQDLDKTLYLELCGDSKYLLLYLLKR